jgi:maltooligosyltrehalose trehalohydrolase
MATSPTARRLPVGAELIGEGVDFRVWAPRRKKVDVVLEGHAERGPAAPKAITLTAEADGYFSGRAAGATAGTLYRFRVDGEDTLYPDPVSRFQPDGPHGPSQVVDPTRFAWTDQAWHGAGIRGQVVYEMHIGTFTQEGTWEAASRELPELAALGITVLEIMPVAEFPGRFGWGYDGVNMFAPTRLYGSPDDFRRFVDRAHAVGLGVILDVVYNHFGPDGNYVGQFSQDYFATKYKNEWGEALNFDDAKSGPVREFFLANAGYWVDEFHIDGLRLDATQQIFDDSPEHIVKQIGQRVREAARGRATFVVAENESQESHIARPIERGGHGLDGLWNDDFHHSAVVALTGHNDAYYTDYLGKPQEFISAVKYGYLYQGQVYAWQKKRRGHPGLDLVPAAFVNFLENHDQVANSGQGLRLHQLSSPGRYRAMTALTLLAPGTPMLFQGQEFASSKPFVYFADHNKELNALVKKGRTEFLTQFRALVQPEAQALVPDPGDPATFERCKLDIAERKTHTAAYALHRDLLKLRKSEPAFQAQRPRGVDGAVLGENAFVLRFFADRFEDERLLVVNLGRDFHMTVAPEPLLAPLEGMFWGVLWSSEDVRYGGGGITQVDTDANWWLPGEAAVVLAPRPRGK